LNFTQIRSWAKSKGYTVTKDKEAGKYYWRRTNEKEIIDNCASGVSTSVKELATDIFNDMTDNRWICYQNKYKIENNLQS